MKCVVTGGAGFIGSHLAERLLSDGHEVHILDDLSLGYLHNVPDGATFHEGSILDQGLLNEAFKDATYVFHQAALGSVPRSVEDPVRSNDVNVNGTLNVLCTARDAGVEKVVFASSSSIYGDTPVLPKIETMTPQPISPYAVTKITGEYYCKVFHDVYGLRTTALRYFNVFGPRQDPNGAYAAVIPKWIQAAMEGKPLQVYGDGTQSRDFTYVANAVQANVKAAMSKEADGQAMNVATEERVVLSDVAARIIDLTGSDSVIEHVEPRAGDIKHSLAGIGDAQRLIGYVPEYGFDSGLKATVESFSRTVRDSTRPAFRLINN